MKKIVCVKKCFGFQRRLWEPGQTVEIADNDQIPPHFQFGGSLAPIVKDPNVYNPMEPIVVKLNQPVIPRGGMATGLKVGVVESMPTAGSEALKKAQEVKVEEIPVLKRRGRPRVK
jgi:hypothetical protein